MKTTKFTLLSILLLTLFVFSACQDPGPLPPAEPEKVEADIISVENLAASGAKEPITSESSTEFFKDLATDKTLLNTIGKTIAYFDTDDAAPEPSAMLARTAAGKDDFIQAYKDYDAKLSESMTEIKSKLPADFNSITPESLNFSFDVPKFELDYQDGVDTQIPGFKITSYYNLFRASANSFCDLDALEGKATKGSLKTSADAKKLFKFSFDMDGDQLLETYKDTVALNEKVPSVIKQLTGSMAISLAAKDAAIELTAEQYDQLYEGLNNFKLSKDIIPITGDLLFNFQLNLGGSFCTPEDKGGKVLIKTNLSLSLSKIIDGLKAFSDAAPPELAKQFSSFINAIQTKNISTIITTLLMIYPQIVPYVKDMLPPFFNGIDDLTIELSTYNDANEQTYTKTINIENILAGINGETSSSSSTSGSSDNMAIIVSMTMSLYPKVVDYIKHSAGTI